MNAERGPAAPTRRRTVWRRSCILVLSVALTGLLIGVAGWVDPAWARAGSGGGYSGSGSSGSSGSSGGGAGDLIFLLFMLIRLCFEMPIVGIPLKIVLLIVAFFWLRSGGDTVVQQHRGRVINKARKDQHKNRTAAALASIRRRDEKFDPSHLQGRTAAAFKQIQQAWSAQDLSSIRPYVSDGIFERFTIQIEEQKDLGYRNVIENLRIESIGVALATSGQIFDEIAFRIGASATDYRVDLKSGRELPGSRRAEHFVEYWSLIRRKGAQTPEKGLFEGNCPNCGDAIALNKAARCQTCQSVLRSGEYDWVLSEITQASEWPSPDSSKAPGLATYRRQDPGFNLQHIEDRASVIFWRKAMADRTARIDTLQKVSLPAFYEKYAERLPDPKGRRSFVGDCAVGAVETLGIVPATRPGEEYDRVLVAIHWSGRTFSGAPGKPLTEGHDQRIRRDMFVLARRAGVKTDIDDAISSAHCGNCGAPESYLAENKCESCGTVLGDGALDWVLEDIDELNSWTAQGRIKEAVAAAEAAVPVEAGLREGEAIAAAVIAGQHIATPAGQSRLPQDAVTATPPPIPTETSAAVPPPIPPPIPDAPGTIRQSADPFGGGLLTWTIQMALIDERMDDKERERIRDTARAHDFSDEQVDELMQAAIEGRLSTPAPANLKEGRRWMAEMIDMALIDGSLGRDEHKLLIQAGDQFGFSPKELDQLIRDRRKALYAVAKYAGDPSSGSSGDHAAIVRR